MPVLTNTVDTTAIPAPLLAGFDAFLAQMTTRQQRADRALRMGLDVHRAGLYRHASRLGLFDPAFIPAGFIRASGWPNQRHIDGPERVDTAHDCPTLPDYDQIPAAINDLCAPSNQALHLRGLGIVIEDKAAAILNRRIRGVVYALILFHLWNGDDIRRLRFSVKERKAGRVFAANPRWHHPDQLRPYWPLAWVMHTDGTHHANALAYLHALTVAWSQRTGKVHVGEKVWEAITTLTAERAQDDQDIAAERPDRRRTAPLRTEEAA